MQSKTFLTSKSVRERYGGIADMTLWRWLKDERVAFPKPRYINNRRYWLEDDLEAFDAGHAKSEA